MPRYRSQPIFRYRTLSKSGKPGPSMSSHDVPLVSLNGVKPVQLLLLAVYAKILPKVCEYGWTSPSSMSKLGAAVVGVLSMGEYSIYSTVKRDHGSRRAVTGLLLSYRFSSALARWDEGKKVWVELRTNIRDGIRMLSLPSPTGSPPDPASSADSSPVEVPENPEDQATSPPKRSQTAHKRDLASLRTDELCGLLVGYAFALQHHLHGTRPLPQPPLSDLLPPAYLSSLRRTEARVRFVDDNPVESDTEPEETTRPGLRRRPTGPSEEKDWELSDLRLKAEEAVEKLSQAVVADGDGAEAVELRQQLSQLNIPSATSTSGTGHDHLPRPTGRTQRHTSANASTAVNGSRQKKSNLCNPYPPNLPLALLRLMESYVVGLAEVPVDKGGWGEAKRERGLGLVKALTQHLGDAERLSANPPPLPLTIHLTDLLRIYLAAIPPSLMCVASGWTLVLMSVIAGWCFLGLEALISDVGGVFGHSENHHPLPRYTQEILNESLDLSPSFMRYYRDRLVVRVGEGDDSVLELDRRNRKGWGQEWLPSFEA